MEGLIIAILVVGVCIVPVIIEVAGWILRGMVPSEPNGYVGYRTRMSTSSVEAWNYANSYCGKLWMQIGWKLLLVSVAVVLIAVWAILGSGGTLASASSALLWTVGGVTGGQCLVFLLSIRAVEKKLRQEFNPDGTRRVPEAS